ncbi:MAG: amino acid adenylation domain-containing protein, partial [bacterium]|nr:amino acid adenylation domain-containing protein [bacterium]
TYWLQRFDGDIPRLELLTDYKRPDIFTFKGADYSFDLDNEETRRFRELAATGGGTLFMNALAALNVLFYKYTGQEDIIIGSGIAGRHHADLQTIIGMFVNALAMRNHPQAEKPYMSFYKEVVSSSLEAFENQDIQFEELVDKLELERDPARNPLFDVSMVVQNFKGTGPAAREEITAGADAPDDPPEQAGLPGIIGEHSTSKFDMAFFVSESSDTIHFAIEYYTGIFKKETIARMAAHLRNIVRTVINAPSMRLKNIEIMSPEEKHQVLYDFNDTEVEFPAHKTIHQLFEEQTERTPHHTALVFRNHFLTYRELNLYADSIAGYLFFEKQVKPYEPVGLLMSQNLHRPAVILGILKAGAVYLPLDPALPEDRRRFMLDDACVGTVISEKIYLKTLNRLQWECTDMHTFLCIDSTAVDEEEEREHSELMSKELWHHVGEEAQDEIAGGGWTSSFTGEPMSQKEMDEYGDNILEKLKPLLHKNMKVLEIGAASGIGMFRIAPHVGRFVGTDLSEVIIQKNRERISREGIKNIRLETLAAHEIDTLQEKDFDLIILNSVIQCFHGHNYLRRVIRESVALLKDTGLLFMGDIMDRDKKAELLADLREFKNTNKGKGYTTKTDLSAELFVPKAFWEDLSIEDRRVEALDFSAKIHTVENELTRYRYDLLITVNKQAAAVESEKNRKRKYRDGNRSLTPCRGVPLDLKVDADGLAYIIYTSGTTGRPKGVMLEHRGITSLDTLHKKEFRIRPGDHVLQFANISFDASVWEIFMGLLNGAALHLPEMEIIEDPVLFQRYMKTRGITLALFPPPYAATLQTAEFTALRMLITGGSAPTLEQVADWSARFDYVNAYGPTESTICCTCWRAKDDPGRTSVTIGKPVANLRIFILDDTGNPQPIGAAGELCIAGVGVARGYLNNPQLTAEKFSAPPAYLRDPAGPSGNSLYRTGDLARRLTDGNIEFLGRIDSQVKIRGYRIELKEIEAQLAKHDDIEETAVIDRNDNGDTFICAYIVPGQTGGSGDENGDGQSHAFSADQLNSFLSQTLPDYMLPAHYVVLNTIPLTTAGKIDRKKLPPPMVTAGDDYTAPRDHVEETLSHIWSDILAVEQTAIGIDVDFFTIGGHSLKATRVTNRIHKELEVRLPLAELFKRPTIRGQAEYIRTAAQLDFSGIPPIAKKEYYPLSSAQKRMYFLQQMDPDAVAYNMPMNIPLGRGVDKEKLEAALKQLIARHESLRTAFVQLKSGPVQRIYDTVDFHMEYYDLPNEGEAKPVTAFVRPFRLDRAPLLRSRLVKSDGDFYNWAVDIHHIVSDGTSSTLLIGDFIALYRGRELPPLRIQYKEYAEWQNRLFQSDLFKKQEAYWLDRFKDDIPRLELPADFKRPDVFTFSGAMHYFYLDKEETRKFRDLAAAGGGTLFMSIMAALNVLFYKYTGQQDIIIGSGIAGRHHADLHDIIGMFINTLAMRNQPEGRKNYLDFYKEVVAVSLEALENQDVQFEELVDKLELERDPARNPLFDISMVVQNFTRPETRDLDADPPAANESQAGEPPITDEPGSQQPTDESASKQPTDESNEIVGKPSTSKFDMTFHITESDDIIHFSLEYYTGIFKHDTIARLATHFKNIVGTVIDTPTIPIKNIDIMTQAEKQQVLYDFNDTAVEFPSDKTIHQLFAEQTERTPDHTALVFRDRFMTYRELNRCADSIAGYLFHEKQVKPYEPVGLLMAQNSLRPAVIFGILKAKAVYLPLDPALPEDRLRFMLDDACVGTVISEKKYIKTLNRLQWECAAMHSFLCIDSTAVDEEKEREHSELMSKELWHHVGEEAEDDIGGGGWTSSFTGEPMSKKEMDEYGDNILEKLEPLLHKNMKVLEIGAASGLGMFRIAPRVGRFVGTDLSEVIIQKNRSRVSREGFDNIRMEALAAHEIEKLEERDFDLIIMNSVVQCFHGHNYLRNVIKKSLDLLKDTGFLFLGDIMDLDKKADLLRDLLEFKTNNKEKGHTTKTDLSAELFIPKIFWENLAVEDRQLASLDFS